MARRSKSLSRDQSHNIAKRCSSFVYRTMPAMIAGRAVAGCGGGGIICLTLIVVTDLIPLAQRYVQSEIRKVRCLMPTISQRPLLWTSRIRLGSRNNHRTPSK